MASGLRRLWLAIAGIAFLTVSMAAIAVCLQAAKQAQEGAERSTWVLAAATIGLVLATLLMAGAMVWQTLRLLEMQHRDSVERRLVTSIGPHWHEVLADRLRGGDEATDAFLRERGLALNSVETCFPTIRSRRAPA